MKMTNKLATQLMDDLAMVAISANGTYPDEEAVKLVEQYAREKFVEILTEWEETFGEKWEIEELEEEVKIDDEEEIEDDYFLKVFGLI